MALNTEKQIKSIFYNNTEIPLAAGSSEGNGFSITFPATAAKWNNMDKGSIIQADGTVVDMLDYSKLSGKTFSNVIAIKSRGKNFYYILKMVLLSGKIATIHDTGETMLPFITTDGGTTFTGMGNGSTMIWILLADTVLSSIEMYDTDS